MSELTDAERLDFIMSTHETLTNRARIDTAILAERRPKDITPTEKHIGALVEVKDQDAHDWLGPYILSGIKEGADKFYPFKTQTNNYRKARLYMGETPCLMRPYTGTVEGEGPWLVRSESTGKTYCAHNQDMGLWQSASHYCPLKLIEVE